jgi:hypothetical protein
LPDRFWHWIVTMPDGHFFDASRGVMDLHEALADMNTEGVASLERADEAWRERHSADTGMADNEDLKI